MPDIELEAIYDRLRNATDDDEAAHRLLAEALDALELPTQQSYGPAEVVAIGTYVMEASRRLAEASPAIPEQVRPYVDALQPLMGLLRDDLEELNRG